MADVVVVGSGAAGLAAAVAAAARGARVTVLETAERLGGTTCLSGGLAWTPGNPDDPGTPEDARRYLADLGLGDHDAALCEAFVGAAAGVTEELARVTPLRWHSVPYPDYHAEFPGGQEGGRALEPDPVRLPDEVVDRVRDAPNVTAPITYRELATGEWDREEVARRRADGTLTLGRALIASLLAGALDQGVSVRTGERVRGLLRENGHVRGVRTDSGEVPGRVVLASGGFERDPELVRSFLRGPMTAPAGVPTNVGDGLRMAMSVGCALGNLSEAWWSPAIHIPEETIDGAPMYRVVLTERARPGSLIVDGHGRRFGDEGQNYNDVGRSLHDFDAAAFSFPRVPAWMIFDGAYRARYNLGPVRRGTPDPAWLRRAEGLSALAEAIGVPAPELVATVERFNGLVAAGRDTDFGRGDHLYDRFMGDPSAPNPVLGAVAEPPFYALEILPGCLGTKGGPRTDDRGRALHVETGEPVSGLYAAGNAAASPFGFAYPGPGATLGPALVFGHRAGEAAAED
ncbi:MAG: Fumarate reductase flavoprotein subunit [Solirubrobacterales bacterium]|nr:Fumarate reductase flavoprotein subunit [Solirubrobacterales bacterium]